MFKNDHIPVLTDLIEKGTDIKLTELGLGPSEDLILEASDREEPHIDVTQLYFETEIGAGAETEAEDEAEAEDEDEDEPTSHSVTNDPDLEQTIRHILNEHMEHALTEIRLAIQKSNKSS
jgi:CRISPR/Cas system-associated protein Csx1